MREAPADQTEAFDQHRKVLFSIAYRMLGSISDAEDMVQETFLRWQNVSGDAVQSPKSYLSAVVTRLCIDQLRASKTRREEYVGSWLPEPLLTEPFADNLASLGGLRLAVLLPLVLLTFTGKLKVTTRR